METKTGLEAIKAHMYEMAEGADASSSLWIYLDFLDDLVNGFLAYRPLFGNVESLEEILEHDALVVMAYEHGGTMATYIHGENPEDVASASDALQTYLAHTLPGSSAYPAEALSTLAHTGREIVAAITMSRARSERPAVMLFYLPMFDEATIFAALKGAIAVDS
ncbi:MAG: hypothetical protein QY323_06030 [Patescibacteria group bacterium]|nr:MAG: hypothetical protein QY323_06030 [Patescibacteria group bacterium]